MKLFFDIMFLLFYPAGKKVDKIKKNGKYTLNS